MKASPLAFMQLPFFIASELFSALWITRRRKYDVVHAHWSIPQGLSGLVLKRVFGIPCVISLHGSDVYALNLPFLRLVNKKVIVGSDACTANSRATAEAAQKITRRDGIQVIPMGVDFDLFSKSSEQIRKGKDEGEQSKVILYAGRLIDVKGVEYLIKALPSVLKKHADTRLYIVGSGPNKRDLKKLAEELHLQDKVVFNDAVSQEELIRYYSRADVFVLPSVVTERGETEGLGVVLLEAMACGVPVIGTKVGGIPDIIEDGETGLLALEKAPDDLAEKICALLSDEDLKKKVRKKAFAFVMEEFSWGVIAERYAGLYGRLMGTGGFCLGR